MITVNRHHYFISDNGETKLSTFSRLNSVREMQASELLSRANFSAPSNLNETRQEHMFKAAVHENVPGYKHLVVRDLADALGGSTAAEDTSKSLALRNLEQTDPSLGERDTQEELNQQAALDIQENAEAFVQGGF